MLRMTSRKHIPRGCSSNYIPGLTDESKSLYEACKKQYSIDPFGETTIDTGNTLIDTMKDEKKKSWKEVITSTDLTHNSRRAWQTIRKLSNDPTTPNLPCVVNANQVAHQLLINGLGTMPTKPKPMLNVCFTGNKISKIWIQSKIIAILKPGKDSAIPKNYRKISLLCHTYTLHERMILNRIAPVAELRLIKEQAGFRTGKSCTSQLLNLTQRIEDGYQRGMITSAAFVDLSAAYDTVNHIILIQKLYNITQDSPLCRVIQNMLSSRRFYVELNNERSRWRKQKNG